MTKIMTILCLSLFVVQPISAQQQDELNYPDLIPVLVNDSLYGYCDQDLNLKINPKFEHAELFEEDFHFQIYQVRNTEVVQYGTADYAWVDINEERYRINKKGEPVYKYNPEDFKKGDTVINLFMKSPNTYVIDGVDSKTLFQLITDSNTGKSVFPDEEFLAELNEKAKDLIEEGVRLVYYPKFEELPFSYFTSEETFLRGIKNTETGEIIIKAHYALLDELYNNYLRIRQYPLVLAYGGVLDKAIYIGLDGTEYIIKN
ncbi:hypothetical protein [Moheibacter sp.]|uniref:hypothetical protein n=1 Tax=Moheibacter sp. TaxID=1965316 RepID=UPI003C718168